MARAAKKVKNRGVDLPIGLFKTIHHFVPEFFPAIARIPDPRDPARTTYRIENAVLIGLLMFVLKVGARRKVKYRMNTKKFIANVQTIGRILFPGTVFPDTLIHGDTLNKLLKRIDEKFFHQLRVLLIYLLVRRRRLEKWRILGCYCIAIDGTGVIVYQKRHCDHCLTRKTKGGKVFYHPVLEAKLVCPGLGLALSIATEFIENPEKIKNKRTKQDCELKAFYRLIPQLRKDFPQMAIVLLLDAIYAKEPVFKLCDDYNLRYLITFKKGSMRATWKEYEALKKLNPKNQLSQQEGRLTQTFRWINEIDYNGRTLNALELTETKKSGKQEFFCAWLSNWIITKDNVKILGFGGRNRWLIESGFNVQKNGGYELEHAFSTDNRASKNFYLLLQMAHAVDQLTTKGSLLRETVARVTGGLRNFSERLWALMVETLVDAKRLQAVLNQRIQIRLAPG
ncbi:hypothetical protein EPO44_09055 [bacterium]|nr:MAG: hypothetical protein EPO44_09055 [bacterium]